MPEPGKQNPKTFAKREALPTLGVVVLACVLALAATFLWHPSHSPRITILVADVVALLLMLAVFLPQNSGEGFVILFILLLLSGLSLLTMERKVQGAGYVGVILFIDAILAYVSSLAIRRLNQAHR